MIQYKKISPFLSFILVSGCLKYIAVAVESYTSRICISIPKYPPAPIAPPISFILKKLCVPFNK